jgi:hypothetical protein
MSTRADVNEAGRPYGFEQRLSVRSGRLGARARVLPERVESTLTFRPITQPGIVT